MYHYITYLKNLFLHNSLSMLICINMELILRYNMTYLMDIINQIIFLFHHFHDNILQILDQHNVCFHLYILYNLNYYFNIQ